MDTVRIRVRVPKEVAAFWRGKRQASRFFTLLTRALENGTFVRFVPKGPVP